MKTFIIKVKDSDTGLMVDYLIERAKTELAKRKTAFAAIYGYEDSRGKKTYFDEPLIKYSEKDLIEFVNGLRNGNKAIDKTIYVVYRNQLDD